MRSSRDTGDCGGSCILEEDASALTRRTATLVRGGCRRGGRCWMTAATEEMSTDRFMIFEGCSTDEGCDVVGASNEPNDGVAGESDG
jgi:hypothetical protein